MISYKNQHKLTSLYILIILALTLTSVFAITNVYATELDISDSFSFEYRMELEERSNIAYNNILKSFSKESVISDMDYGENYAGAYINEDGNLVVLIATPDKRIEPKKDLSLENTTDNDDILFENDTVNNILSYEIKIDSEDFKLRSDEFQVSASSLLNASNAKDNVNIIFQEAKYSYTYLNELKDVLEIDWNKNLLNTDSIWSQITSISILDDKNCIKVNIVNMDNNKIKLFKSTISDSEAIIFENSNAFAEHTTSVYAGEIISRNSGFNTHGSIGYKAVRWLGGSNYEFGFVTVGHGFSVGQTAYQSSSSNPVGICTDSRVSSTLDAAFIKLYNGYKVSSLTNSNVTINYAGWQLPATGGILTAEGSSSGRRAGKVTSQSESVKFDGAPFVTTDLLTAGFLSLGGDSGGIAYSGNLTQYPVGIVLGCSDNQASHITKAGNIDAAMGVWPSNRDQ